MAQKAAQTKLVNWFYDNRTQKIRDYLDIQAIRQGGSCGFYANTGISRGGRKMIIDFTGVITFTPSWGDEFISPLHERYKNRLVLKNVKNSSVVATLKMLETINKTSFKKID